jgi:hypothetical protein
LLPEVAVGQAGEWIAAAALIELGVQVMVSPTEGADLLAYSGDRYFRIEVKTANTLERRDRTLYRFSTGRGAKVKKIITSETCDIVALVSLPERRVIFRNVGAITSKSTRLSKNRFIEGCEKQSWEEAIKWK